MATLTAAADPPAVATPIRIFITGNTGYVWTAEEALRLRRDHRLVGTLIGGVPQFKNQNVVNGLPLELNADEVTQAWKKGWATLHPLTMGCSQDQGKGQGQGQGQGAKQTAAADTDGSSKRKRAAMYDDDMDDYYAYYEAMGGEGGDAGGGQEEDVTDPDPAPQETGTAGTADPDPALDSAEPEAAEDPSWRDAVADGSSYLLPVSAREARQRDPPAGPLARSGAFGDPLSTSAPEWPYPRTPQEALRFAVFSDLHDRGFTMSGGSKFGADMLAYPGDPSLYHAQFTVRLVPSAAPPSALTTAPCSAHCASGAAGASSSSSQPQGGGQQPQQQQQQAQAQAQQAPGLGPPLGSVALSPMLLKAAGRGSHAARKHLLLASLPQGEGAKPIYISIAPEAGFGSKA